ncbi:MAG: VCBS repeat-containing protein [Pseudomonadota bacterium]
MISIIGGVAVSLGLMSGVALAQQGDWTITNKSVGSFAGWAATSGVKVLTGDFNGDSDEDIALIRQTGGWNTVPVAFANGSGGWNVTNKSVGSFAGWAATSGVQVLTGDFNGDNRDDVALIRKSGGWNTVPVAFADGSGGWTITNKSVGSFAGWAATSGVRVLTGDFNGDNRDDIALIRQSGGWNTVPVAFADGSGGWTITNKSVDSFAGWAATSGVRVLTGDFNGDSNDDIALIRQTGGWNTVPVAFSDGSGGWNITNKSVGSFAGWAATSGVQVLTGDFNGDNDADIALIRKSGGWNTVPVAFADGSGGWSITNKSVGSFAGWAATSGVQVLTGDFNGDNDTDIALIRRTGGWNTVPVAFANGSGGWSITNKSVGSFAGWAATGGVKVLTGQFSGDNETDIALIRQSGGWNTVPVAFATNN